MTLDQGLAFFVFAFVAAVTPGPSNVMLAAAGAAAGIRGGLPCLLGVAAGMASMMLVVGSGLGALIVAHPLFSTGLKWIGAAFLLWLAWKIATAPAGDPGAAPPRVVGFAESASFQWLNPKAWLATTSAAGTFMTPEGGVMLQAAALAGLFIAAILPAGFVWLAFGVAMRRWLGSPSRRRAFNVTMGLLLAASVVFFVF